MHYALKKILTAVAVVTSFLKVATAAEPDTQDVTYTWTGEGGEWYRLKIDAVRGATETKVHFSEFSLYDVHGGRLNVELMYKPGVDAKDLKAYECCLSGVVIQQQSSSESFGLENLFDEQTNTRLLGAITPGEACVTLRLPKGAEPVASYNFTTTEWDGQGYDSRQLTAWTLEKSSDGINWNQIDKITGFNPPAKDGVLYLPGNFPVAAHSHVLSEWETIVEPTCTEPGYETRTCTASGCTEPPYAETNVLEKLGHDYQDGKCTRCGADDPGTDPGRPTITVTKVDGNTVDLAFSGAGERPSDFKVWAVGDVADRDTDGTNDWARVAYVGRLQRTAATMSFEIPDDWGWGSRTKVLRFLTTPVYDAKLTGLIGCGDGTGNNGQYFNTLLTPNLSDKFVVDLTTPAALDERSQNDAYEAVFSARRDGGSGDRTMTAFVIHKTNLVSVDQRKRIRFDYGLQGSLKTEEEWLQNRKYTLTLDAGKPSVEGPESSLTIGAFTKDENDAGGTLLLFATRGSNNSVSHLGRFTLHSFKWFDSDGKLLHDYIPVVSDGVNALYDTVAGEMLEVSSAGSGVGGFGAEGTPDPVTALTWSRPVGGEWPQRQINVVSQDATMFTLAFSTFSTKADLQVWAVADATDKGTAGTNGWAKVARVGLLEKDENEMTFDVPSDWNWGTETKAIRFLTTPVYDAKLEGLRGNRSDVSAGYYIDTGLTPSLSDKLVAELTTSAQSSSDIYEAVFSARNVSSAAPMTAVVCHNSSTSQWKNKVRFDYGNGGSKVVPSNWSGNGKYTVTLDAGAGSVTGLGRVDFDKQLGDAGGTLLLFALRGQNEARNHIGRFTLHSFKWFDSDGELLHDYIPVVSDGVNTLYDTVAGEMLEVSSAGSSVGGFGAEGTPDPVTALTWSEVVKPRRKGLMIIFEVGPKAE